MNLGVDCVDGVIQYGLVKHSCRNYEELAKQRDLASMIVICGGAREVWLAGSLPGIYVLKVRFEDFWLLIRHVKVQ